MSSYTNHILNSNQSNFPRNKNKVFDEPQLAEMGRLVNIGQGLFPRVLSINKSFYVFLSVKGSIYYVKEYDENWQFTGFEKRLTPDDESDIDQDIAFDGEHIYEYAMRRPSFGPGGPRPGGPGSGGPRPGPQQGFRGPRPGPQQGPAGQIRKFDKDFNLVKCSAMLRGENDVILDQNIAFINGNIYAGSEYRENKNIWRQDGQPGMQNMPPNPLVARGSHLRILDRDLNILKEMDLVANIKGAVVPHQYWGLGVSQLYADGYYCGVVHSPIGNVSQFDHGESIGARQIFILRFDDEFNFVDSKGPLSDTNYDNFWCTGSWYEDGKYYISYVCRKKGCVMGPRVPREPGEGSLRLGIFDKDFNELETIEVNFSGGGLTKILKIGNKLYITYASRGAFVQELILKTI